MAMAKAEALQFFRGNSHRISRRSEKDLTGSLRASHAFAYDAGGNRTSACSARSGATARVRTATHNSMSQITTFGSGGQFPDAAPPKCWTAPAEDQ